MTRRNPSWKSPPSTTTTATGACASRSRGSTEKPPTRAAIAALVPSAAMPRSAAAKAFPLVLVLTLVWGTNWALFPLAVKEVSVWTFRAVSLLGAGVLLLAFARARGIPLAIPREHWFAVTAAALIYLVVWNLASTYAAILIPSGQAAILGFTMPLWTVLVVWLALGER